MGLTETHAGKDNILGIPGFTTFTACRNKHKMHASIQGEIFDCSYNVLRGLLWTSSNLLQNTRPTESMSDYHKYRQVLGRWQCAVLMYTEDIVQSNFKKTHGKHLSIFHINHVM